MIKRIFCLCAALIFATGCTGGTAEVRERIYVQSAVLDAGEYTSLELFLFEGTGELVEGVGKDIFSATENAAVRTGREIFLGHTELLCLKSPMDSSGLMNCLDEYRLSPGCRLLLLQGEDISEDTDTTKLTDSLKLGTEKGNIPQTDLFTILKELQSADGKALAPLLTEDGISMCITDGQNILGILSQRATIGLVWLRGDNHPERITVTGENGTESFQVYSACTDVSAQIIKGIPHIKAEVKIKGKGNTNAACNMIKAYCQSAIDETAESMRADVFGIEAAIARDCSEYYAQHDFDTVMRTAVFEIDVREK